MTRGSKACAADGPLTTKAPRRAATATAAMLIKMIGALMESILREVVINPCLPLTVEHKTERS